MIMKTSVLVPAKGFDHAKKRLASIFSERQRRNLAKSMFCRVLQQARLSQGVDGTFVVTRDGEVSQLARLLGAQVIAEHEERGESQAVSFAIGELGQKGVGSVLVLPGDLPLLRTVDVESILHQIPKEAMEPPFALLTPSWNRLGTNAILLSPPNLIYPRFGYDSFGAHLSELASKRIPFKIVENDRIAVDIDEPDDLKQVPLSVVSGRGGQKVLT